MGEINIKKNISRLDRERHRIITENGENLNKGKTNEYQNNCNILKGMRIAEKILLKEETEDDK